jgi:hypothetical protein
MHWYASYRTGGSTVMHIFKRKEHAIAAACKFLNHGHHDALEVGPMLGSLEENRLDGLAIRRIWDKNSGAATPDSVAPAASTTSSRT